MLPLKEKERERLEKEANRRSLKEVDNYIIILRYGILWKQREKILIVCSFGMVQEKELRRQQEEAEKGSKMREAAMRKQSALLKQANLMGRFLHSLKKDHKDVVPSLCQGVNVAHDQLQETHNNSDRDEFIQKMDREMLNNGQTIESLFK